MVYNAVNGQVPAYLSSLLNSISAVAKRMLHNSNLNLRPPRMKTKFGKTVYRGATIQNSLPSDCKTDHTFPTFNVKLRAILSLRYFISLNFNIILYDCILACIYTFFFLKKGPLKTRFSDG